jgi:CHAD domain-containing protein
MPNPAAKPAASKAGLAFWMHRVLEECGRAADGFAPGPVHDLRVALRRCRSMADGLRPMDPDPAWKQMKKAGKALFGSLGDLRDVQVMEEWVHHFDTPGDPVTTHLLQVFAVREAQFKQQAAQALQQFDQKLWRRWARSLPHRAARVRPGSILFKHLALERWTEAYQLHRRALRNRSQASWHRLRIGIKRFRYIVENFLPEQHAAWSNDLKQLQDMLGEVHDLDVLWSTARQVNAFPDPESRARWHARIHQERESRIAKYREKMLGKDSLWHVWRSSLPHGDQVESAALRRLILWASFLDPDFRHSQLVARLALQLYQGLSPESQGRVARHQRAILRLAALLHDVGRSQGEKKHHKRTYRLLHNLPPPLGVPAHDLRLAAIVARYHRGALPRAGQKTLHGLSLEDRPHVLRLAAILRFANALDADRSGRIHRLEVHRQNGFFTIAAAGYSARDRSAESIAGAGHLLEVLLRRPILVKPLKLAAKPQAGS